METDVLYALLTWVLLLQTNEELFLVGRQYLNYVKSCFFLVDDAFDAVVSPEKERREYPSNETRIGGIDVIVSYKSLAEWCSSSDWNERMLVYAVSWFWQRHTAQHHYFLSSHWTAFVMQSLS